MKKIAISILSLFLLVACKLTEEAPKAISNSPAPEAAVVDQAVEELTSDCPEYLNDPSTYNLIQYKTVNITSSEIRGNELHLSCEFSGCESDELILAFNGIVKKSYPGQASLKLGYVESGQCDAIQSMKFCYDISDLGQYGKIMISVNGNKGMLYDAGKNK